MMLQLWSRKFGLLDKWVIIDDADAHLAKYRWLLHSPKASRTCYARAVVDGEMTYIHRAIMGDAPEDNLEIDHIDGDGLNCVRSNLEWVTHAQNIARAHARDPFNLPGPPKPPKPKVIFAGVHRVISKGHVYFYDRKGGKRLTAEEAKDRIENSTGKTFPRCLENLTRRTGASD